MLNKTGLILSVIYLIVLQSVAYAQAPDTLWTKTYGYPDGIDECWEAVATPDDGLAIVGSSTQLGNLIRLYVVRINSDGDTLWTRTYADYSEGRAICMTSDLGFILSGVIITYDALAYIIKIDSLGNEVWSRVYETWGDGAFRSCQAVGNDGYVLAGYAYTGEMLLVRIDSAGDTLWSRVYGGPQPDRAWSAKPTSDGGFIVAGWTESFGNGLSDFYIIKTDQNGDSLWARTFGGQWNEEARDIIETGDGGFLFCGKRSINYNDPDYYLMKIDSQGDSLWAHYYRDWFPEYHGVIHSLSPTLNGGYGLIGYNVRSDIIVLKTNNNGDSLWAISFIDDPSVRFKSRSIIQSQDGSYFLCGYYQDIWVVKLAPDITGIEDEIVILPDQITLHQNYPNPFNANTTISFTLSDPQNVVLSIYDLLGRKVSVLADGYYDPGIHNITFDAGDLTSGIYFYNLKVKDISETKSMILLK
ncbi:MAG: T9SS type A sorting domain-containing protein [Candidatus Zixiibacteriota bacterium]|nr:MAG: T9SS type A sorting domain-containing protein [candidate division Zixibacteria bacterium]